jgi:hypothetical protein
VTAFTGRNRFISIENIWSPYKNSKTTRDAYLGLDLSIHVNHSAIHLVTQSLLFQPFGSITYSFCFVSLSLGIEIATKDLKI